MKEFVLIEAPTNLGLKEPAPGIEPGVKYLPDALSKARFGNLAGIKKRKRLKPPPYSMHMDAVSKIRNADAIASYSRKLAAAISEVIRQQNIPIIAGGDCSVIIGAGLALRQMGLYGLFHLDGHTDYMLPAFSQTGGAAGMGLALIAGKGPEKLSNIDGVSPYIEEENIYCVGNREYDEEYVQFSLDSKMRYIDLDGIRKQGPRKVALDFLQMAEQKNLDGFWLHFDVDALNDEIMPCVDSRTADGLWYQELRDMLSPLFQSALFTGMEITILDPTLDTDGIYVTNFVKELSQVLHTVK
jgi:arginase